MASLMDKAKQFVVDKIAHIEKPSADVTDIDMKNLTTDSVTLESAIDITNPYDHDLPIWEISFRLRSADKLIASGTIKDPGSVKANDKTGMIVPVTVPYNFLISIMKDLGRDWDIDYEWDIGLTMHIPVVGKFTLPLNKKGTMKLPTLSDIF
uniref:Lea protein n=1 Tax=Pseudotsuga menziesii TaxID=3357 RepID=Q9ZQW6_PSEMZ|nr:Lea protein [Pseudotsuga menziesii]